MFMYIDAYKKINYIKNAYLVGVRCAVLQACFFFAL